MVTEDEVLDMDESIFADPYEMSLSDLPDLPDSVWMRMLANALDPEAPAVGADLIPVDLPTDTVDDAGDDLAMFTDDSAQDDSSDPPVDDAFDSDDGSDLLPAQNSGHPSHDDIAGYGFGSHDSGSDGGDSAFGGQPWTDHHNDGLG